MSIVELHYSVNPDREITIRIHDNRLIVKESLSTDNSEFIIADFPVGSVWDMLTCYLATVIDGLVDNPGMIRRKLEALAALKDTAIRLEREDGF